MIRSIARQNNAGARTYPWRTPEEVLNAFDSFIPTRTRDVPVCRSWMSWIRNCGAPVAWSASHRAWRSTESKAALISQAACSSFRNSRCSSARRRNAMASIVERLRVKPDCCGLRWRMRRGCRRSKSKSTWVKTLPGTYSSEIGL